MGYKYRYIKAMPYTVQRYRVSDGLTCSGCQYFVGDMCKLFDKSLFGKKRKFKCADCYAQWMVASKGVIQEKGVDPPSSGIRVVKAETLVDHDELIEEQTQRP